MCVHCFCFTGTEDQLRELVASYGLHDRRACGEIVTEMLTIIRHSGGESRAVKTRVAMYVDVMFFMSKSESI